jgi:hypothetical protein
VSQLNNNRIAKISQGLEGESAAADQHSTVSRSAEGAQAEAAAQSGNGWLSPKPAAVWLQQLAGTCLLPAGVAGCDLLVLMHRGQAMAAASRRHPAACCWRVSILLLLLLLLLGAGCCSFHSSLGGVDPHQQQDCGTQGRRVPTGYECLRSDGNTARLRAAAVERPAARLLLPAVCVPSGSSKQSTSGMSGVSFGQISINSVWHMLSLHSWIAHVYGLQDLI